MFKRLPSRNNRSKSVRVKHVLQICLLLGVCFWLIYQVKHSHDKKKEFDTNDSKTSVRKLGDSEIPKLGRKDLHRGEDVIKTEKHEEEEEEETSVEEEEKHEDEEQEEEQNKHGVDEQEEEEAKNEETEEEGRGGGDDEIDENDQERKDGEGDRDEDFIDEEKEREDESDEKESEDKESQGENESLPEDQDNDGSARNTHEAREENYKGDDASSAVTHDAHDTQMLSTETENVSSENANENQETNEKQNKTDGTEDVNEHENKSELVVGEGGTGDNGTSLNLINGEQKVDNRSSNPVGGQGSETMHSNEQQEEGNNSIQVSTKTSNDSTVVSIEASNKVTGKSNETSDSFLQNGTQSVSYSDHLQNVTIDGTTTGESVEASLLEGTNNSNVASEDNQSGFNSTGMENGSEDSRQFSDSSNKLKPDGDVSEKILTSDGTAGAEEGYRLSVKVNTDATQNEKSDNGSESDGTDEKSDSTNDTEDSIQQDPIDSSDTHATQDEKEVRTDLDTLPDIKTEGDDNDEAAAE